MKFFKLEGTGNDFVFFQMDASQRADKYQNFVRAVSDRNRGVGADGVVFVWKNRSLKDSEWNWRIFNRDGGAANACGNASRCLGLWLQTYAGQRSDQEWKVRGDLGLVRGHLNERGEQEVSWQFPLEGAKTLTGELSEQLHHFNDRGLAAAYLVQAGVPHLVLVNHDRWDFELRTASSFRLRAHSQLGKGGANVTWVDLGTMSCVTFERGVEAETLSCGSGAIAAHLALLAYENESKSKDPLYVSDQSGDKKSVEHQRSFRFPGGVLEVRHVKPKYSELGEVWLSGPCSIVFEGELRARELIKLSEELSG